MKPVNQLRHVLVEQPPTLAIPGVWVRNFQSTKDVAAWLELRHRAFARERVGVGQWTAADFEREFTAKPWWRPEHLWFAEVVEPGVESRRPVGTVTLARRGEGPNAKPVVHWLAVLPAWRRHGVGRLLMSMLHRAVWNADGREVWLETHADWAAAARFYDALGYRPAT